MYTSFPHSYFEQLNKYLAWQTRRIQELEIRIEVLTKSVEALSRQRGITVERLEYKFDQLKVEKLDGTLNIGISPGSLTDQTLEDILPEGKTVMANTARSESFGRILNAVLLYLKEECPRELQQINAEYQVNLGENFCKMMSDDLYSQARSRTLHYMQTMVDPNQPALSPEEEQAILQRVIGDIQEAIRQYIVNKKEGANAYGDITGHK